MGQGHTYFKSYVESTEREAGDSNRKRLPQNGANALGHRMGKKDYRGARAIQLRTSTERTFGKRE